MLNPINIMRYDLPPRIVQRPLRVRRTSGRYRVAKMKLTTLAKVMAVAPKTPLGHDNFRSGEALTGVSPAKEVKEEAVIVYSSIRRDRENLRAKHTGQRSVICSGVLGHLAGVGQIGELIAGGSSLISHTLSSGARAIVNQVVMLSATGVLTHWQDLERIECFEPNCKRQRHLAEV